MRTSSDLHRVRIASAELCYLPAQNTRHCTHFCAVKKKRRYKKGESPSHIALPPTHPPPASAQRHPPLPNAALELKRVEAKDAILLSSSLQV